MLQSVRKYTQGWVATIMGIILSFAFVMWGIENYSGGHSKKNIAAKVNGKAISTVEVNNDFQRMIMRLKDQMGSSFRLDPVMQQQLRIQALYNLIIQNVLTQSATKAGFRITPQETSAMIKQMPVFQEKGNFSKERFELILSKMGYTQPEFFSDVSQTLLLNQVASGIAGSSFVLPNELNQAVSLTEQKRDIEYALIPSLQFKKSIQITENNIHDYYLRYKNQFKTPAKIQIEYVQLSAEDLKKSISVTDQDVNEYFVSNSDLDRNNPEAIQKAKESIKQQKLEQAFLSASDKLTDLIYTNPNSLYSAAKNLSLKINTSEYFTQEGGNSSLTKNPKILATAFNSDLLKNRVNSNLIEITPGTVVAIRVKDFQPEAIAPMTEVKGKIKQTLTEAKARVAAKEKGVKALTEIKNKDEFRRIASAEHLSVITKDNVSRNDKNINPEVLQLAFSSLINSKKPAAGAQLSNGDFVILVVKKSINFDINKMTKEQRSSMEKKYTATYGKLDYNLYTENQMDKAKVKNYLKE